MLHTMSEADGALLELLDALGELRRFWERPDRKRRFLAELGEPVELATLRTLAAVERSEAVTDGEPGVGDVAEQLAVDASTASRLAEQAVRAGYLTRAPGRADRRRTHLQLTDSGRALTTRATLIRRRWLDRITAGWSDTDVEALGTLLRRFLDDATASEGLEQ
jgi:DNA-binding MarR family transcriptional regulator